MDWFNKLLYSDILPEFPADLAHILFLQDIDVCEWIYNQNPNEILHISLGVKQYLPSKLYGVTVILANEKHLRSLLRFQELDNSIQYALQLERFLDIIIKYIHPNMNKMEISNN